MACRAKPSPAEVERLEADIVSSRERAPAQHATPRTMTIRPVLLALLAVLGLLAAATVLRRLLGLAQEAHLLDPTPGRFGTVQTHTDDKTDDVRPVLLPLVAVREAARSVLSYFKRRVPCLEDTSSVPTDM
jgi:hypothetical protein